MRFKLNLNGSGTTLCALISLFAIMIPVGLSVVGLLLQLSHINSEIISRLSGLSIGTGLALFVLLIVLLVIEWMQDRHLDAVYRRNRHRKLPLSAANYECQYCGNRQVKAIDRYCRICGKTLT